MSAAGESDALALPPDAASGRGEFRYVRGLDGLRGVAILAVMAFHIAPKMLPGGFLGVDLFFVLSGFLITALLLQEWDRRGAIHLGCFYARRALRLLPAAWLLLLTAAVLAPFLVSPTMARKTQSDALLAMLNVLNWWRAMDWSGRGLLVHMWSLCVEEQFYLLWPGVLVVLLHTRRASGGLGRLLLAVAAVCALHRVGLMLSGASWERIYNGLDTRADALVLGCALAAGLREGIFDRAGGRSLLRMATPPAIAGLALAIVSVSAYEESTYFVVLPVVAAASGVLIIAVTLAEPGSRLRRCVEAPWLVWIGRRSYGLYLWHYPVYRCLGPRGLGCSPVEVALWGTGLVFLMAAVSFAFVEQPILRWKERFQPAAHPGLAQRRAEVPVT